MSGVIIARRLLTDSVALLVLVPSARILAGVIPQGTALPCIAVTDVSSTDRDTLSPRAVIKVTERVQITVMGATYAEVKAVLALARKACRNKIGTVGSFTFVTCRLDGKGPDFTDANAGFALQSQDLLISFNEPA